MTDLPPQQPTFTIAKRKPSFKKFLPIFGLVLLVLGAIAAFFLSKQTQDTRQQANIVATTNTITQDPSSSNTLPIGQKNQIKIVAQIQLQTKTTGFQYVANIIGTIPTDMVFIPTQIEGLNIVINKLENSSGGKKLTLAYLSPAGSTYTVTSNPLTLGTLEFTPTTSDGFSISPDQTLVKVVDISTQRNLISAVEFSKYSFVLPSASVRPTSTPSPVPTVTSRPTATPTPKPTTTASSRPTPTPGTGGIVSCNKLCSTDTDCKSDVQTLLPTVEYMCYIDSRISTQGVCRLRSNPSSTTCVSASATPTVRPTPTPTPTIISRPTPTPTTTPSFTARPTPTPPSGTGGIVSCNKLCTTDTDCKSTVTNIIAPPDYACYVPAGSTQGVCRLRSNPTSSTCSAATPLPTISRVTPTPLPTISRATPTPTASSCRTSPADFDKDCDIDLSDYSFFSARVLGTTADDLLADLNGDGIVNLPDYSIFQTELSKYLEVSIL